MLVILVAAMAAALLILSWPRLRAALHYLPVDNAIERFYLTGDLPPESLEALQDRALESIALQDHQRYWDGLGLLYYLQGSDNTQALYLQRESFQKAVDATDQSLRLAPVQPRAWMRRAHAEAWLSFKDTGIVDALKMSVYTGRVETGLLMSRLQLGYSRLGQLDDEARGLLRDQTLLAWRIRQRDVTTALKRGTLDFRRVAALLITTDPAVVREMEESGAARVR